MIKLKQVLLLLGLILIFSTQNGSSARILAVVPTAAYSHQMFFQQFWRELAIRGHDIVVITTDPTNEKLANFKEVDISASYVLMKKFVKMFIENTGPLIFLSNTMHEKFLEVLDYQLSLPQVQEIINNKTEHFDLLIIEQTYPVIYGLKHRFNCPIIGVASMDAFPDTHAVMGNPVHSVLYPLSMLPFQENLSFLQRLVVFGFTGMIPVYKYRNGDYMNELARKHFGDDVPDVFELLEKTDMLFVNANPLFSPVRPHTPSTISVAGGMHLKPVQPLPKDLENYLDNAKEGVIYFSLGSNVKSNELSVEKLQTMKNTLAALPYKILWKFEDDSLPGKPENVKIIKWAPQQDILRHKNVKLFITQGGLQSLEEAIYSHMPLVAIPFSADQDANGEKVKRNGLGVVLDRYNLNTKDFKAAVMEVMNNPMYRDNVVKFAARIQDEPMKPLDKAVWWTEYVLRHKGAQHLKGPRIPFYQYYYMDVIALMSLVMILVITLIYIAIKLFIKLLRKIFVKQNLNKKIKTK